MHSILPTTWRGPRKYSALVSWMNKVGRLINGMTGLNGVDVVIVGEQIRIIGSGGSAAAAQSRTRPFTPTLLDNGKVLTRRGFIIHGASLVVVNAAQTTVTGGTEDEPTYCHLRYNYASRAASIDASTMTNVLSPTNDDWIMPLWSAFVENDRTVIREVLWDSVLVLSSVLG